MGRRSRSLLITLSILVLGVGIMVPLSRAQIIRITRSALLLPQQILPLPQKGPFAKEDGETIINAAGEHVR